MCGGGGASASEGGGNEAWQETAGTSDGCAEVRFLFCFLFLTIVRHPDAVPGRARAPHHGEGNTLSSCDRRFKVQGVSASIKAIIAQLAHLPS
jgi:hypothetical protein